MWKSDNQGFKEAAFIQMAGRRGGNGETAERLREVERRAEVRSCRMSGPTSVCGGLKLGGIPREQGIPDPDQTTQPRVSAPGR